MGTIIVTFDTSDGPQPYGSTAYPYGSLSAFVTGPKRLADLFRFALARSQRRIAERARAGRRPRLHAHYERLTADSPVPAGWHLAGTCPDCERIGT